MATMLDSRSHVITAMFLFAAITGGYFVMAWYWPVSYIWSTYEDLHGEWAQTWLFFAAMVFSLRLALTRSSYRWFFLLLGVACFYVVMEEISWGQRIFGFESPAVFKQHNLQRETNLHNFLVGPYSTLTKDIIEYTLATALLLYGLVYPLLLRTGWRMAEWLDQRPGLPAPPLYLWPFFVTAAWLETAPFHFNEAEVAELLVGSALVLMTIHYRYAEHHGLDVRRPVSWQQGKSLRLALLMLLVITGVAAAAGLTTWLVYEQPDSRARIEQRLLNGYEKFAGRYERRNRPEVAAELYRRVYLKEPGRTSILRRMAISHRKMGDEAGFERYTRMALNIGLEKYAVNPDKISTNLSLARSYRQLGESAKAHEHALRAHSIAMQRWEARQDSASRNYWLAKTYRQLGNYQQALKHYRRAFELKPSSKKYRKAYYSMRKRYGTE